MRGNPPASAAAPVSARKSRRRMVMSCLRGSRWAQLLLNLGRGGIARTLVVDPADFQIVALVAALEAELDIGILGDGRSPVRDEHVPAVMFEGDLLDEMRRNDRAIGIFDESGIHRMLDQRLDFGSVAARCGAHANGRCHQKTPSKAGSATAAAEGDIDFPGRAVELAA